MLKLFYLLFCRPVLQILDVFRPVSWVSYTNESDNELTVHKVVKKICYTNDTRIAQ